LEQWWGEAELSRLVEISREAKDVFESENPRCQQTGCNQPVAALRLVSGCSRPGHTQVTK
jgi:hypothetical protein